MADVAVKLQGVYKDVADGSSSSRSWGNINPDATEETLVEMARLINSLQDTAVKTLVGVKRVESKELSMTEQTV